MTSPVLIVLQRADVAEFVAEHQRAADAEGIAVLRCAPALIDAGDHPPVHYHGLGFQTPSPLPRGYDITAPELTRDMVETILSCFEAFQRDGILTLESNLRGLWFQTPWGQRPYIGLARLHDGMVGARAGEVADRVRQTEVQECVPSRST